MIIIRDIIKTYISDWNKKQTVDEKLQREKELLEVIDDYVDQEVEYALDDFVECNDEMIAKERFMKEYRGGDHD